MGKKTSSPEPIKSQEQIAQENLNAQISTLPRAAQVQYDILANPEYGLQAQTQLQEDVRRNVFGNENAVRDQLVQNILQQLQSPTGLTPEQQRAVDERRNLATQQFQEAQRTRSNLGGGLFGGRAASAEEQGLANLQNIFTEEDIARQERNRLNNQQIGLSILQSLFPQAQIAQPNFLNPVASPSTALQADVSRYQNESNLAQQQAAQNAALQSALFQSLGTAAGAAVGGPAGAGIGSKLGKISSGNVPGTGIFGSKFGGKTQTEILGFPTAQFR